MVNAIPQLLAGLSLPARLAWLLVLLILLTGIGYAIRRERRHYQARAKGGSWLWVRLSSVPILAATAAIIALPARHVSGMEALAVFYASLLIAGPLLWFGLHWLAGFLARPRLTGRESAAIAASGLAILLTPFIVVSTLQGPLFSAVRLWELRQLESTPAAATLHEVHPIRRFILGTSGEIHTQALLAPPGLKLQRVEAQLGGNWQDTATQMHVYLCRENNDLHLAWPAGSPPPPLRLFWRQDGGELQQAQHRVDLTGIDTLPGQQFAVAWREDGFDLPVPLSRSIVWPGWRMSDARPDYRGLNTLQPGETFQNDCVMPGYTRVAWREEGPITAVMLRFYPQQPAESWGHEVMRQPAP